MPDTEESASLLSKQQSTDLGQYQPQSPYHSPPGGAYMPASPGYATAPPAGGYMQAYPQQYPPQPMPTQQYAAPQMFPPSGTSSSQVGAGNLGGIAAISLSTSNGGMSVNACEGTGDNPFIFRAELSCCTSILLKCSHVITCMQPFVVVSAWLERSQQFRVGQYKMRFDGTAGDYCCNVCVCNSIMCMITGGLWECCGCAHAREGHWIDTHLHLYV